MLTKPDLLDRGAEDKVMEIMRSPEKFKVKKGFVMVKLRSQEKIKEGQPLADAIQDEMGWFRKHQYFG